MAADVLAVFILLSLCGVEETRAHNSSFMALRSAQVSLGDGTQVTHFVTSPDSFH